MGNTTQQNDGGENDPARLLSDLHTLQSRAGITGRGYWLPLLLFGALICESLAFYEILRPAAHGIGIVPRPLPRHPGHCTVIVNHQCKAIIGSGHVQGVAAHITVVTALGYYWQLAIPAGVVLTVLWYRWRGDRVGLRTPALGFLITGIVLAELVLLVPLLAGQSGSLTGLMHDTRHAGPLVIIAVLLWVLAWAERSRPLAVIAAGYLVIALVVSRFTDGGIAGGTTGAADVSLASLRLLGLLPAAFLLIAGLATWAVQRLRFRHLAAS
jgi:hypothetical protein